MDYNTELFRLLDYAKRCFPHMVPPILWGPPPNAMQAPQAQPENTYCTRMPKDDAERYVPANGTRAVIFDSVDPIIYMISTDNNGKTSTTILDYQERVQRDPMADIQAQMASMQNQIGQLAQILSASVKHEESENGNV